MRRGLVSFVFALALMTGVRESARAQGIELAWNTCANLPGAAANVSYACDGSRAGTPFTMVVTFLSPQNIPAFESTVVRIDIRTEADVLPDFWRLAYEECRFGGLDTPVSLSDIGTGSTGSCQNPFLGAVESAGFGYFSETGPFFPYVPGAARLFTSLDREGSIALASGQRYLASVVTIDADLGADVCVGCNVPATFSLREVNVLQPTAEWPNNQYTLTAGPDEVRITWQLDHTPVRNRTWGSVKATYR